MPHPTPWESCSLTITEWEAIPLDARVLACAALYLGWGYSPSRPRVAFSAPGYPSKLVDPEARQTNCSTFTSSLIFALYPSAGFGLEEYADMQVYVDRLPQRPAAPIEAVVRKGVGLAADGPIEWAWNLVQGWRKFDPDNPVAKERYSGHAFLVKPLGGGMGQAGRRILVLDAAGAGVRLRERNLTWLGDSYPKGLYYARLLG